MVRFGFSVLLVLWATLPLTRAQLVVTLGGGFAAGTGMHVDRSSYDDQDCLREADNTPGPRLAATLNVSSIQLACYGATTLDVVAQLETAGQRFPDEAAASWSGSIVVANFGADNLRTYWHKSYWKLVKWCDIEPIPFLYECHFDPLNNIRNYDDVDTSIVELVDTIASTASGAKIRIMGYGEIFQPPLEGRCGILGMNNPESDFLDAMLRSVNAMLQSAVEAANTKFPTVDLRFVDMTTYIDTGVCAASSDSQIRGGSWELLFGFFPWKSRSSYHPNSLGYDAYFEALMDNL